MDSIKPNVKIVYHCKYCKFYFETKEQYGSHKIKKHGQTPDNLNDRRLNHGNVDLELYNLDHTTADLVKIKKIMRSSASAMKEMKCYKCERPVEHPYKPAGFEITQDSPLNKTKYFCKPICTQRGK